jgi:hypothetical protein
MATLPKAYALFETSLQDSITSSATSMTLIGGTDKDGSALSGTVGFIIDEGTASEEFVIGSVTGTAVTSMLRGVSVADGTTEVAGNKKAHRKGATVKITDHPVLIRVYRVMNGDDSSGSNVLRIGDEANTANKSFIFDSGESSGYDPEVRYDYAANQLKFRRRGETSLTEIPLSLRGTYANYAALPTDASDGDIAITTDDYKLYVYDLGNTTWVLAGGSSGAGTMYVTEKLGSEATGADNRTFDLSSGSWPSTKFLMVYQNGQLMREGATEDFTEVDSNTILFNYDVEDASLVTMIVVSVDLYNPDWENVTEDILPDVTNTHTIGDATHTFSELHLEDATSLKVASATPTADTIPIADGSGNLDEGWLQMTDADATTLTDSSFADSLHVHKTRIVTASDTLQQSADTEQDGAGITSFTLVKEIQVYLSGNYRIKFDLKRGTDDIGPPVAHGRIYKNGVALGTDQTNSTNTYQTFSEDLDFDADDKIQLYYYSSDGGSANRQAITRNFRLYGTITSTADSIVNTD